MRAFLNYSLWILISIFSTTAYAGEAKPVTVQDAWVRAAAPGQKVGAAYMTLSYDENITLVAADADVAETVEIHSMEMKNGVMKMRSLENLPIQAGKPAKLAPNGLHLMLFGIKKPLNAGEKVELTLCFKDKNGKETHQTLTVPIKEFIR